MLMRHYAQPLLRDDIRARGDMVADGDDMRWLCDVTLMFDDDYYAMMMMIIHWVIIAETLPTRYGLLVIELLCLRWLFDKDCCRYSADAERFGDGVFERPLLALFNGRRC